MRLKMLAAVIFSLQASYVQAQNANVCDSVLAPTVFNVGETQNAESFASSFKDAMCQTEWSSESDAETRAREFNLSFKDVSRSLGIGAADNSGTSSLKERFNQFCSRSIKDIAYSSSFFNKYRSSDFAVAQWSKCINSTNEGHFALVVPDESLTGATIRLARRSSGAVPPLKVLSIQPAGDYDISCFYNSQRVTEVVFPEGQREFAISCIKRADIPTSFIINTNWGPYDPVYIPGYSRSISALQADIAEARSTLTREITSGKAEIQALKSKSIKKCRVCFRETEGSSQCQGNRNSCSDWASVGGPDPQWTQPFRDDTDNRPDACTYQWRLQCE